MRLSAVPQGKQHAQPLSLHCRMLFCIMHAGRKHPQRSRQCRSRFRTQLPLGHGLFFDRKLTSRAAQPFLECLFCLF